METVNNFLQTYLGIDFPTFLAITLLGFVVGLASRILMPGRDPMGAIGTCLLGLAGAYVGTFINTNYAGIHISTNPVVQQGIIALGGSIIILAVLKLIRSA